ncbi:AP-5 complex subunit beta-1-like isoform X2 [Mya arenaria]|uniref:AP-5 complex subunit beta-1-like isoform X2 n=1 Tax=Mya arenaria TaxID=6604 RepID=UPI0022DE9866|nr:AP-5 complex subunit beta-1-like isoform X2 [Mya arenaria]
MAKQGNENYPLVLQFRAEIKSGKIVKRFQDEFYALDLLRILYEDTVKNSDKVEILIALEEYGHLGLTSESVDQVVVSMLGVYQQTGDKGGNSSLACQILTTASSLVIQLDMLKTELCDNVVKELVAIVTTRVNQPGSENLRACACQSLIHMEEFAPGMLCQYFDEVVRCCRQERSHVFQDYSLLAATLMENIAMNNYGSKTPVKNPALSNLKWSMSMESHDFKQTVAYLVEQMPMFTRSGSLRMTLSLANLVLHSPDISPMAFKPLMLHQMATMSCVIFQAVLCIQRKFGSAILTAKEECDLVHRLCVMTSQPCLNELHRLLAFHWVRQYKYPETGIHESIIRLHRLLFYPSVFNSVDIQLANLYMTALCGDTSNDTEGSETSILLGSLGCLHKLVWHTGSGQAAKALFRALYFIYTRHNNISFSRDIQRFVRGLISEFAHFIPHSMDFVDSIHSLNVNSEIFVETLSLLHQQVVMATEEQIYASYPFYLLIMKKVASQLEIDQSSTIKFLQYLAENAADINDSGWRLGQNILDICRNIVICHGTQAYYQGLCGLLFTMLSNYNHTDVQDKAKLYYSLVTRAAHSKVRTVLQSSLSDAESMSQALSAILPETSEKKSLATIIHLDTSVFTWDRLSVDAKYIFANKHSQTRDSNESECSLSQYVDRLKQVDACVRLTCRLQMVASSPYQLVHAVSVSIENSTNFKVIPKVHVACLPKDGVKDIAVQLTPNLPLPQTFQCSVDFFDDSKQTFTCSLPPVGLEFSHMMMPLPWQPTNSDNMDTFFSLLWDWVLQKEGKERKGIQSVKLFDVSAEDFQHINNSHLKRFAIGSNQEKSCNRYAIFLPPSHHVLLKCQGQRDDGRSSHTVVVTMVMDITVLLPHVDKFLQAVFNTVNNGSGL